MDYHHLEVYKSSYKVLNDKKFAILNLSIEDVKVQFEKWYEFEDRKKETNL